MHNNYYFLTQLTDELRLHIIGHTIVECFSQNKNELIIILASGESVFNIKASLSPSFCCLSFPGDIKRAKKNSISLFEELVDSKVVSIKQFLNERCFSLILDDGCQLLFKMHGNRSNIILIDSENQISKIFNSHLKNDYQIDIRSLDRPLNQTKEAFLQTDGDLPQMFPTFGKVVQAYLASQEYKTADIDKKWTIIEEVLSQLSKPQYYLIEYNDQLHLSLLPIDSIVEQYTSSIDAINDFFISFITGEGLRKEKSKVIGQLQKSLTQSENYLIKAKTKLQELSGKSSYSQLADLIMANLHQIKPGAKEVSCLDFYNDNEPITIKLRDNMTAQKNAENLYRKSKNQAKEIRNIEDSIATKKNSIATSSKHLRNLEEINDYKTLNNYLQQHGLKNEAVQQTQVQKPFNEFQFENFAIYVGRNAKSNDKMLQSFTFKDDLWLHAKDVGGSHVIVKYQSGKKFPKSVIEKAAQLAAFHSKRKTDSLCPVIYTPRKFVRKRKGDPAGAVVVDREDVILVEPKSMD